MTVAVKILGYDDGVRLPFHGGGGAGGIGGVERISGGTGGKRRKKSFSYWVRPYLWSWAAEGRRSGRCSHLISDEARPSWGMV